ncbi:class F sortase [Knoellia sp. Soil729]|uniref:class F sortase n=1 Tax=Knoellia sp. Soil729 TaxID=1736394 RepID=UPI0006F55586|nr:class F sortase [Knoellia sp. Soil729]KRE41390.1 hypothetical protein ASG74_12625 [Knoellia sp. Soil729]
MPRRPLLAGGVVALVVGSLLLALGLDWERGGAPASASSVSATSSARSTPAEALVPAPTRSASGAARPSVRATASQRSRTHQHAESASTGTTPPPPSEPNLAVSSIGLDVSLSSGGVDSSGKVNPPAGRAMWVRGYGRVKPGNVGTAVVAGHVVASGRDDVFADLPSVHVGNTVLIRAGATTRTYVVRRAAVVTKVALTHDADVWGQNTSKRRIVLITCDADLGYRSDGHRVANYVVVADAV